jgi:hypothetical protein
MGLKDKLRRLEKASEGLYKTLVMPDGTEIRYRPEEILEAVAACVRRREHRLLPYIRRMETNQGMPGLIRALEGSREPRSEADE